MLNLKIYLSAFLSATCLIAAAFGLPNASKAASPANGPTIEWARQLGTSLADQGLAVSADGLGGVYISGLTAGDLAKANTGGTDAFLGRYDSSGGLLWIRQLGSINASEESRGVSADGLGNVYISGSTGGSLAGPFAGGFFDSFLSKYDASGNQLWIRQFGTSSNDFSRGISADGLGNVFITGETFGVLGAANAGANDAYLAKYDASGNQVWVRQLGTSSLDDSFAVSADGFGNAYITGSTGGDLDGSNAGLHDAFLAKYDSSGELQWTRQLGTSASDLGFGVSADERGDVYITGRTQGDLDGTNAGSTDAFLSKYDSSGDLQWTRQLGTDKLEEGWAVSSDGQGNVYISGSTTGSLSGTNFGRHDVFLAKYDSSGMLLWTEQLGTGAIDISQGVSADRYGNIFISGWTEGDLAGPNAGSRDAFVIKFIPEPTTLTLAALGVLSLLGVGRRRRRRGTA